MQDKIWSHCIPLQPRLVQLEPSYVVKDQVVTIGQVSQYPRVDLRPIYGYVELGLLGGFRMFHPEVDILVCDTKVLFPLLLWQHGSLLCLSPNLLNHLRMQPKQS